MGSPCTEFCRKELNLFSQELKEFHKAEHNQPGGSVPPSSLGEHQSLQSPGRSPTFLVLAALPWVTHS